VTRIIKEARTTIVMMVPSDHDHEESTRIVVAMALSDHNHKGNNSNNNDIRQPQP